MGGSRYQQIPLRPLGHAESESLLASLLGGDASLAPVRERILDRADGNPFFTEELVKALTDAGALAGAPGNYRLVGPVSDVVIPESVQALLAARIDRLTEQDKRVLQIAAVIGRDFGWTVLLGVAQLSEDALRASLDALVHAEFIYETELYPEPEYCFKHALTQNVAYEGQLQEHRNKTHTAVAGALESEDERGNERSAEIAQHLDAAGDDHGAALAYARAGDHAGIRFAEAAARYWTRVLELTEGASSDEMLGLRLRAYVARLLRGWSATTSTEEARQLLLDGRVLAERLGDRAALMRLESTYALLVVGDDPMGQFPHLERALALVDESTPLAERISLHQRYSWTHGWFGDARIALETAEAGLALDADGASADPCLLGYNSVVALLATRVDSLAKLGRLDEARQHTPALLDTARQYADPLSGMLAWHAAGLAEMLRGNLAEADRLLGEAIETASELDVTWAAPTAGLLAEVRQYRGDLSGGLEAARLEERILEENRGTVGAGSSPGRLRNAMLAWLVNPGTETRAQAEEALSPTGEEDSRGEWLLSRATLTRLLYGAEVGERIEAELQRAEREFAARGIVAMAPIVHAERAELAALLGNPALRERELREAIRIARQIGAHGWVERFESQL
jgi:tetratricopeptide (TPR) repeat protein